MPYTFSGVASNSNSGGSPSVSVTLDIGATPDNFVVVAVHEQNGNMATGSAVHVGGVALAHAVSDNGTSVGIWYGVATGLSGNQAVTFTSTINIGFEVVGFCLWYMPSGINLSQTASADNSASCPINVASGDYLFSIAENNNTIDFSGSTESPAGSHIITGDVNHGTTADWTVASTNASFNVATNTAFAVAAASFKSSSQSLTATVAETVTAADGAAGAAAFRGAVSESGTASDSPSAQAALSGVVTESAAASDTTNGTLPSDAKITDTQSYAWVIQNAFFDALTADPFFIDYTCRKTPMNVVLAEHLPYLGVYLVEEKLDPDGDPNAHPPAYIHAIKIGFSVLIANNDMNAAYSAIDAAWWRIMNRILTDGKLLNVMLSSMPDNVMIEAIPRGVRRPVYGAPSHNQQTPIAEARYEQVVTIRSYWPPVITDDLLEIDVQTGVKPGDTLDTMAQRMQVLRKYMFQPSGKKDHDHG